MKSSTLLIVDDDPSIRQSLTFLLHRAGYLVTAASSPEEGLQTLRAGPFDLVLVDLRMPGMDGLDFLSALQQIHPDTPVFILTGHASLSTAIEAMRRGARDYFIKPLQPDQILVRIREELDRRRTRDRRLEIADQMAELLHELRDIEHLQDLPGAGEPPVAQAPARLARGPFVLDLHARQATLDGQLLRLSPASFDYLAALLRRAPQAVTYEDLVREVQGYNLPRREAQSIARWQIHQLRQSIEPDPGEPRYILNERGLGYRLALPAA